MPLFLHKVGKNRRADDREKARHDDDRLLIAPSTSPISSALAVPSACAAEPMLTPLAMGSVMRKSLHTETAITLPKMPVMMIMATVSVT